MSVDWSNIMITNVYVSKKRFTTKFKGKVEKLNNHKYSNTFVGS